MCKAEEKALKKYPAERCHMHNRPYQREGFIAGYRQAEKDLELTWEDLATIEQLSDDFVKQNHTPMSDKEYYQEILKQFNKERKLK